ncbi:MAG: metallophosphoesterase family protein [Deltaproteobacteria bacterium]|nr:metallophosphoesterase family protein [Deltaproteobacteria bacterium]
MMGHRGMIKTACSFLSCLLTLVLLTGFPFGVKADPGPGQDDRTALPCSATLWSDAQLTVPIINSEGAAPYYAAKFQYSTSASGNMLLLLNEYRVIQDPSGYSCEQTTMSSADKEAENVFGLYFPDIVYNNTSYWALAAQAPTTDGKTWFKIQTALTNPDPANIMAKAPYLLYSSDNTGMTVMWQTTHTPLKSTIEWGYTTTYENGPITVTESGSGADQHQFSYAISRLLPNSLTYYRVTVNDKTFTGSFRTAPVESATTLSFYSYGDTRQQANILDGICALMLQDMNKNPDRRQTFTVNTGDFVMYGLGEAVWNREMFNPTYANSKTELASLPMMGAVGNHEGYHEGVSVVDTPNTGTMFRKYWPYKIYQTPSRYYYSFDYGPVHIAVLDTWSYPDQAVDAAQLIWLENDLKNSTKPWKVVATHTPLRDCQLNTPALQTAFIPILERNGVKLVVQGHAHYYSHVMVNGITYLTVGGGGAPLEPVTPYDPNAVPYIIKAVSAYHFARMDIDGNTTTVTVIKNDGSVLDTVTVTK